MSPRSIRRSQSLWNRALARIPSGTQCYSKGPTLYSRGVAPVYLQRSQGCRTWDVDGNEFIDLGMGLWAVTLGHQHPAHTEALIQALRQGTQHTLMHPLEVELAEALAEAVPLAEMCRFGRNGSDVTTAAVRLARAVTGREVILRSGYHGWHDWTIGISEKSVGVPAFNRSLAGGFEDGDRAAFDHLMHQFDGKVAGVIMEGLQSKTPAPGYLEHIRSETRKAGALLIFDEVVNGYRMAIGGAHEFYGIDVDLVTFGKGCANGTPLAVLAGRRHIMKELNRCFFSLTFGGETLGLAAGLAVLDVYRKENVIRRLWETGERLHKAAQEAIADSGLSHLISLSECPVRTIWNFSAPYAGCDSLLLRTLLQQELLSRGILWAGWHALSLAHTEDAAAQEQIINATGEALRQVAKAIADKSVAQSLKGEPIKPVFRRH